MTYSETNEIEIVIRLRATKTVTDDVEPEGDPHPSFPPTPAEKPTPRPLVKCRGLTPANIVRKKVG